MNETCCRWQNQVETDDGEIVYPDRCACICHTQDDE